MQFLLDATKQHCLVRRMAHDRGGSRQGLLRVGQSSGKIHSVDLGDAESAFGKKPKPAEAKEGLRSMALEPRLRRRLLGASVVDAMQKSEAAKADHFARQILPGTHSVDETVGYALLFAPMPFPPGTRVTLGDGWHFAKPRAGDKCRVVRHVASSGLDGQGTGLDRGFRLNPTLSIGVH
jgi:hypothetical protein